MSSISASSSMKAQIGRSSSLLDALDAVTQWRPSALLSATAVLSIVLTVLFGALTAFFAQRSGVLAGITGFIGFVVVFSVALIGINATGIWLSDGVWGRPQRSLTDAVLTATFTVHRLLAVMVLEFLFFLVFLLALTLVLFLCKIPGVGPLLYSFVLPLGVIASGTVLFGLVYIGIPLASPAIWNGTPILRTVLMLQSVARTRMLKAIIMMFLLGLMTMMIVGFVWAILGIGAMAVASLSAIVLNVSGGMGSMMSMFQHGSMDGYGYAIGFGTAVLLLIGANPGILIALKGASIIYREVSEGLSLDDAEREMNTRMADMKARAEAARAQAMAHTQTAAPAATPTPAVAQAQAPVSATQCPNCHNPITADDVFCGNCGHKLQ